MKSQKTVLAIRLLDASVEYIIRDAPGLLHSLNGPCKRILEVRFCLQNCVVPDILHLPLCRAGIWALRSRPSTKVYAD